MHGLHIKNCTRGQKDRVGLPGMADSEGKVVITDIASLSEQDSDEAVEIITNKKKRTSSKSNGNLSNSESR